MAHRGVALDDPRNGAILSLLRPSEPTAEIVAARLIRANHGQSPADLAEKVAQIMRSPKDSAKPASQSLEQVADPWMGLGTHPDLIERLWQLNDNLPADCRWVVHGKPALVHPQSGVIFGYATGTLGYALRLRAADRAAADALGAKTRIEARQSDSYDLAQAGPEWRFGKWLTEEAGWCRAAYDLAGLPIGTTDG
jgi:hypothetical protein